MMNLAEYRRRTQSLADFLPWAALVEKGVILNKDGSFQRTARFRGPDLDSATPAELVAITSRLNNALRRLGSGWAVFIEAQRVPAHRYPVGAIPRSASSALVDAERRAQFEEEGAHFESRYFLTLLWLPPADDAARAEAWLYENRAHGAADWRAALEGFIDRTDRVLALIEGFMPEADWLDDGETLTYLHSCISTRRQRVRVPETPMYLDAILVDEDLTGGLEPRLGRAHLRTLTIMGFPSQTWPGLLDDLNRLAFPYRWATRAVCLDKTDATKLLAQNPPPMVRQAQVDHGDPEGSDDQRGVGADGFRRRQQGARRRRRAAGARHRPRRRGLCHRHRHGLERGPADRRRAPASGREDHSGPRFHLHARGRQRHRGVARIAARPRLRQCPPAAGLDAQPRAHDAVLGGLGRAGTG